MINSAHVIIGLIILSIANFIFELNIDWWTLGIAIFVSLSIPIVDNKKYIQDNTSLQKQIDELKNR